MVVVVERGVVDETTADSVTALTSAFGLSVFVELTFEDGTDAEVEVTSVGGVTAAFGTSVVVTAEAVVVMMGTAVVGASVLDEECTVGMLGANVDVRVITT